MPRAMTQRTPSLFAASAAGSSSRTTIEFAVLGSSSRGNASILRVTTGRARRQILIDAGLSPKAVRGQLALLGFDLSDTHEVLFTHCDSDHARAGWSKIALATGLRFRCSSRHVHLARARGYPDIAIDPFDAESGGFDLGPVHVVPCENPHDATGTIAFRLETDAGSIGFATDIGRVSDALINTMRGVQLLAIESNYDPAMQESSNRPRFLKERITSGRGHLSNSECIEAVRAMAAPIEPDHVVLLHLSRECNCPRLVERMWQEALPTLAAKLTIAQPFAASGLLRLGSELPLA